MISMNYLIFLKNICLLLTIKNIYFVSLKNINPYKERLEIILKIDNNFKD